MDEALMKPAELAERWAISPRTLENWRLANRGPPFLRLDGRRVRYRPSDVAEFESKHLIDTDREEPGEES